MKDYTCTVTAAAPEKQVIPKLLDVRGWWTIKGVDGQPKQLGDKFSVHFGDTFIDFEIVELVPERRMVWAITDSHLPWIKNKKEWNGTALEFSVRTEGGFTCVTLTHRGLTPKCECFDNCKEGWDLYFGKSFHSWLVNDKGQPYEEQEIA